MVVKSGLNLWQNEEIACLGITVLYVNHLFSRRIVAKQFQCGSGGCS